MDITIKNIEALQNYLQKQDKPLKGVVVDLEKVIDQDFTQLFFDACETYKEPTLKAVTEHMKSEFEVTGKDSMIFMDNKFNHCKASGRKGV